eukprot:3052603-Alexandrium_andersonii.AAC.1
MVYAPLHATEIENRQARAKLGAACFRPPEIRTTGPGLRLLRDARERNPISARAVTRPTELEDTNLRTRLCAAAASGVPETMKTYI